VNRANQFSVPGHLDLLEFFESEPRHQEPSDGLWSYEISDNCGVTLRFAFNVFERSVETALSFADRLVSVVSHEEAHQMTLNGGKIECLFSSPGQQTSFVGRYPT
jgi:hypothetical protein